MAEVDGLERIADGLVLAAAVGLTALTDSQVDARLTALTRLTHALAAELTRTAHHWSVCGEWASDGSRSAATRLARDGRMSQRSAHTVLGRGDQLTRMPHVAAAFAAGELSTDQVDLLIASAASRQPLFARDEELLVAQAKTLRVGELVKTLAYWRQRADAELDPDGPEPNVEPSLKIANVGDLVAIDGQLDPVGGQLVTRAIDKIAAELAKADHDAGRPARNKTALQAAALVEMARRAMANNDGQPARVALNIACGEAAFARLCELSNGTVIRPGMLVPYLDAIDIRTILFDTPTHASRGLTRRTFVGSLRWIIEVRDRHCQHPSGCDVPTDGCDIDHINPGPTRPAKTTVACCAPTTTASNPRSHDHPHERPAPPQPRRPSGPNPTERPRPTSSHNQRTPHDPRSSPSVLSLSVGRCVRTGRPGLRCRLSGPSSSSATTDGIVAGRCRPVAQQGHGDDHHPQRPQEVAGEVGQAGDVERRAGRGRRWRRGPRGQTEAPRPPRQHRQGADGDDGERRGRARSRRSRRARGRARCGPARSGGSRRRRAPGRGRRR